ncbi:hypothetical protein FEM48_Zijuj06G0071700 [Ziziphus jujuba var. spinosa]|uniref:Uncharacterized protein n=1 Tax=Ziziphus jujuba var. spinosa TaxID=714518 RepID=A0A978V7W4_ZIZJJ|nr:hypothetical protein FEM48_Zijuj06G0071700 [Ziziphus jujuba var. spinosa]
MANIRERGLNIDREETMENKIANEQHAEKDDKEKITDNRIANASIPNVATSQETQNDEEETSKSGDTKTDKLEKASITGLSEQETKIEKGEKHDEATNAPGKKASLAGVTSSGNVNKDEISKQKFDASSIIHENGIQQKVEELDVTEVAVGEARDVEESTVVVTEDITTSKLFPTEDHKELESTEHDGCIEPSFLQQNELENKRFKLNVIVEQQEMAASKGDSTITTCVKEESNGAESIGKFYTTQTEIAGLALRSPKTQTDPHRAHPY